MADLRVPKGSVVEVRSDEPGFHGAWYVGTVVDVVQPSPINKRNNKNSSKKTTSGYLVKYDTLFEEDKFDTQLTELVHPSHVRPLQPRYPRRRNNHENDNVAEEGDGSGGVDFDVDDVIDAFHRDGWWIGIVKEKMVAESNKFIVSFENPPEEVEFKASQLRFHVNWVDGHWQFPPPPNKKQELGDKNATQTSESKTNTTDAHSGFTTPSKGDQTTDVDNQSVADRLASKNRTSSRKKVESNRKTVGSVANSSRKKRSVSSVEEDSRGKRSQSSAGSKRNKKMVVPVTETSESEAIQQDSPLVEKEMNTTETCDTEDGNTWQKRKRGRPPKLQVQKPNGLEQDNQEACKGDSSAFGEITTDIDEQPLAVWVQGLHPLSVLKRRSCCSPPDQHDESSVALNQAIVNKYQEDWPFIKQSPIWATIESLESYQISLQKPHFSPLKKEKKNYREGLAISYMVTFCNLVEEICKLQLSDPINIINNSFETLDDLETHGFDVACIRARLNGFLTWKVKVCQLKDKLKNVENKLEKHNLEKSTIEEEMSELEVKMDELKGKMVHAVMVKNLKDVEINRLHSNLDHVSKEIMDWALAFEKLAATPLCSK